MNSIDYNESLDQTLVSLPNIGEVWILDHSTTTEEAKESTGGRYGHGGDFLYRWGSPKAYGRGGDDDVQLAGRHQAQWVPEGMPGEGHITVFDNGGDRGWSSVVELVPPVDADGNYPLADDAHGVRKSPYGPMKLPRERTFTRRLSRARFGSRTATRQSARGRRAASSKSRPRARSYGST